MATNTSKKASAATKPAEKAATKTVKAKPTAKAAENAEPKGLMVVIDGAGTMPLMDNNGRRVMRGEPVEVSEAEIAWLAANGCAFERV